MARTAPFPNGTAIPGMNPGFFILGGGGDGGGGANGTGRGNGKGQGAGGKGGGNGANGDGKGAAGCGPGSGGGCANPAHGRAGSTHAGDPVDPITGRVYTVPQTDLPLVGPLVLALKRGYSSFAHERDIGLGFGWSHSLAWSIELRRRTIVISPPFLEPVTCDRPEPGVVLRIRGIGSLRIDEGGIALTGAEHGLIHCFEPANADPERYQLAAVLDRAQNRIELHHDARGDLVRLTDSAGRTVHVRRATNGRIEGFELVTSQGRTVCYRRYEHDDQGDLIAAVDAEGRRERFLYDADHRLIEQKLPSGLRVVWRYDQAGRCVETWTDHGDAEDLALAEDVPAMLADGATKARGMLHVRIEHGPGTTMVYDSRQAKRFDHNTQGLIELAAGPWVESLRYDAAGQVVEYCDPNNRPTRYERDVAGRVIAVTSATGERTTFKHDEAGDLTEVVDELGAVLRYSYDGSGNLVETADAIGWLLRCAHDGRGLRVMAEMPGGATTTWEHDAEGNVIALTEPHGKPRRFEVDDIGRIAAFTDEEGHRTVFHHNATNALRAVTLPGGAIHQIDHDADGRIAAITGPDGATWRLRWGGYNCVHTLEKPTGEVLRFRYDREGNLVQVVNERGEVHRIRRDAGGRIVAETFFDGRTYRYKLDAAGRLLRHENGAGERTDIERDPCGRVVRREHDDGTADVFEYDAAGRLTSADNGAVRCEWAYDARGNLVREKQVHEGRTTFVENTYDAANQRIGTRSNTGHAVSFVRDMMGNAVRLVLGGGTIERTFDALGREVLRALPRGGHMICQYDGIGAMVERQIAATHDAADAPAWVGALPPETTFAETFVCSASGDLIEHTTNDGEGQRFAYDRAGRIVARSSSTGAREVFGYEGTGRVVEPFGPARSYGPGGVLLSRGAERFTHDGEGRRITKTDEKQRVTRYEWDGRGMLAAVVLPDGTRVENVHDTQGRRILKRTRRTDGSQAETRFAWAGDDMIHEITWSTAPGLLPAPVVARTYVHDDAGNPLAHRETTWTEGAVHEGEWTHYALGPGDMPALLVAGDGGVLARLRASVWGRVEKDSRPEARTPWRFRGQYEDEETGLFYNRYRFYDPEVGLYINADPIGVAGGLGAYEYARAQPLRIVDPSGLVPVTAVVTGHGITGRGGSSGLRGDGEAPIHPIVAAAMPQAQNGIYPNGDDRRPSNCAEPAALSDFIRKWEDQNNGGRRLDPSNPRDQNKIKKCLGSIKTISAQHTDGAKRAPCPNCSTMIQNLRDSWGAPKDRAVEPGAVEHPTEHNPNPPTVKFSPPKW